MIGVIDTSPVHLNILNATTNCPTNNTLYLNTIIGYISYMSLTINASGVTAMIPLSYCFAYTTTYTITTNYTNVVC